MRFDRQPVFPPSTDKISLVRALMVLRSVNKFVSCSETHSITHQTLRPFVTEMNGCSYAVRRALGGHARLNGFLSGKRGAWPFAEIRWAIWKPRDIQTQPYASGLCRAIELTCLLHAGQTRRSGEPYCLHPIRAMKLGLGIGITDSRVLVPLLLHDTLEESSNLSPSVLLNKYGLDQLDVSIVSALTKDKTASIDDYLYGIRQFRPAVIGKLLDRLENLVDAPFVFEPEKVYEYLEETEILLSLCEPKPSRPEGYADTIRHLEYVLRLAMDRARMLLFLRARNGRFMDVARVIP